MIQYKRWPRRWFGRYMLHTWHAAHMTCFLHGPRVSGACQQLMPVLPELYACASEGTSQEDVARDGGRTHVMLRPCFPWASRGAAKGQQAEGQHAEGQQAQGQQGQGRHICTHHLHLIHLLALPTHAQRLPSLGVVALDALKIVWVRITVHPPASLCIDFVVSSHTACLPYQCS